MPNTVNNVRHLTINDIYKGKVLVVSPDGNTVDPIRGFSNMSMFTTIKAAVDVATDGDLIYILPGIYNENRLIKNNINYYFCQGAKLWFTGTGNSVNDNDDIIRGSNITVDGFGDFRFDYSLSDVITHNFIFYINGGTLNYIKGYKAYSKNYLYEVSNRMYFFEFEEVGFIPNTVTYITRRTDWSFILLSGNVDIININIVNYDVSGNTLKKARLFNPYIGNTNILNINVLTINGVYDGDALAFRFIPSRIIKIDTIISINLNANKSLLCFTQSDIIEINNINSSSVHNIEMSGKIGILKINNATPLTNISYKNRGTNGVTTNNAIIEAVSCGNLNVGDDYSSANVNTTNTLHIKINKCEEIIMGGDNTKTIFWNNMECTKISINRKQHNDLTINPELHFHGNVKINLVNPTQPAITNGCTNNAGDQMLRFYNYGNIITNSTHTYPFGGSINSNILDNLTIHKTPGYKWSGATAILESGGIPSRGLYDNQPM